MKTIIYEPTTEEESLSMASLRGWLQNKHQAKLDDNVEKATLNNLKESAMVFAPHQDDETLGCGGTILRKRGLDADVDVVFLTDGRTSHSHLMSPLLLTALREEEATAACAKLGVAKDRISFLRYPDSTLKKMGDAAASTVLRLLQERQPREVYIPYAYDPQSDHVATNRLVRTVLKASGIKATILEYPVWAWYQWPWVSLPPVRSIRTARQVLANTAKLSAGRRLTKDMNYRVNIDEVRNRKLEALNEHRTQMTRYNDNPNWMTLHDVANGDWFDCFLQRYELFYRYEI